MVQGERDDIPEARSPLKRALLFLAIWVVFAACLYVNYRTQGRGLGAWAALPVVLIALLLGMNYGLLAALVVFPLLALVKWFSTGESTWTFLWNSTRDLQMFAAVLVGAAVGRARDLSEKIRVEISHRKKAEGELRRLNAELARQQESTRGDLIGATEELRKEVVERRRAEALLRASEEQQREIFENASDIVYIHDLAGHLLSVNKAGIQATGYDESDLSGMTIERLIAPEYLDLVRSMIRKKTEEGGGPTRYELEILTKDGGRIAVEVGTRLICDSHGAPIAVHGIARDITERKAAERAQLANLRYLQVMNEVSEAIEQSFEFEAMMQRLVERVLEAFKADGTFLLYPLDPDESVVHVPYAALAPALGGGKMARDVPLPPELRAFASKLLKSDCPIEIAPGDPLLDVEPHKSIGVKSIIATAIWPKVGKPWCLGIHQCAAARRWTDEEKRLFHDIARRVADALTNVLLYRDLLESEDKHRSLVENSVDGIFRVSLDGRLQDANPAMARMLGYTSPSELVSRDAPKELCFHPSDWDRLVDPQSFQEVRLRRRDGEELWVECRSHAIRDKGGAVIGYEGSLRDLTERRRGENERRQFESRIQQAQKMESLGLLAGGIAHDFNNLLMGILGNSGIALMELAPDSPARESVERIETAALRAADLTNQMLAYSGKGKFLVQPVDLSKLVEEMAHLLETVIARRTELKLQLATDLPTIEADVTQLRQVIMNLITNASDAIGDDAGTVSVRTGEVRVDREFIQETYLAEPLAPGDYVFVEVCDSGCGMDPSTLKKIFDPFFTTKFTGRGLGLAAVLGIVRGHLGAICVSSTPGSGTTFKVLLPVAAVAKPVGATPPALDLSSYRGSGTILLIDDEETVRSVGQRVLEKFGFDVITANDGDEGVAVFASKENEITAVILDMTMPTMGGEEAYRQIRLINTSTPIILSSGFTEQEATHNFAAADIAGFIQKPYRPAELLEKLRAALESSAPADR